MRHLRAVNQKADRIEKIVADSRSTSEDAGGDVVALQDGPHIPLGCSFVFDPGWEADVNGGTAGLCQPVERDLFDCYITCYWPAHVPDLYNYAPDWTSKCAAAQKDWRNIDLIFP